MIQLIHKSSKFNEMFEVLIYILQDFFLRLLAGSIDPLTKHYISLGYLLLMIYPIKFPN